MDPPSMHAKLLDANVTSTLHGPQFDVDPMCLEANLVSGQFSKLAVVNGIMDSSYKGNSVMPLHENGPSSAKGMSYVAPKRDGSATVTNNRGFQVPRSKSVNRMEFRPVSTAQSIPVSNVFLAIHNDLVVSEDVVVPHSLVSNALVIPSDPVASAIFSDSVSLSTSHEQQPRSVNEISIVPGSSAVVPVNDSSVDISYDLMSTGPVPSFPRLETILESSTISGLISDVCSTAPIQTILAINSLVQTVSTTMGPSQRPPIPYTTHMVRNDCYGSSQIPSSVADSPESAADKDEEEAPPSPSSVSDSFSGVCLTDAPILLLVYFHKLASENGPYDHELILELHWRFEFLKFVYMCHCETEDEVNLLQFFIFFLTLLLMQKSIYLFIKY
ncbi:hypothetical protein LWI29_020212 [Acer saccharum]|uniref:Uncharacterized protein n=1 Tax=Acer saccharum TaxID=4024 RepID=A0AA39W6N1_ACESA|nr:hypothetical protein LWI29_020212 [Acer saccharum]